ncbi:MAG: hypothetical protein JRH15_15510, partial [Deltaproteobacteria bacterium]|nr:hypothetical protein [Deltaproteobacteria bacterium]
PDPDLRKVSSIKEKGRKARFDTAEGSWSLELYGRNLSEEEVFLGKARSGFSPLT